MRRNPRRLALWTVSIFCALLLAACGGGGSHRVKSITITPATQTISATTTQQFTATVNFADNKTQPGAGLVAWSSGTTSVATIDPASGVATGVAAGTSIITATYKGGSGTATLSVNQLLSITVTPPFAVVPGATSTQQFTAMGTFKNPDGTTGNPQDITGMVTWASSKTGVATINSSGLATAVGTGVTSISAALFGVTSPGVSLTVGVPVVIGLKITPALPTAAVGNTVPFTALELLSDGTTQPLSGTVTWSSATTTSASIGANNGIALGVGAGSSVITATESGTACPGPAACTGTTTLTVVAAVSRFAYVGDLNDNTSTAVAEFSVDVANANLNPLNPASVAGKFPQQLVVHPSGQFVYEINVSNFVQVYDFSPNPLPLGQLKLTGLGPYPAGNNGFGKAVIDPTGQFLYVINNLGTAPPAEGVYGFTINQSNGSLTAIGTPAVPLLSDSSNPVISTPVDVMVDRQGKYLYVVNSGNNTINAYSIDPTSGALTALSSPTIGTGTAPSFGAIDPSNTHLYVANTGDNSVSVFKLDPSTGILTSGGADTSVTGATFLLNVAVDPTGKYLYALDSALTAGNNLYAYVLNTDGTLPATAAASYPTGVGPFGISIDASGTVLAVVNNLDLPTATVSLFSLAPVTGVLKPTATVTTATWMNPEFLTFYNAP